MNTELVKIVDVNGNETEVDVLTYLISEDNMNTYIVYTKGETQGAEQDKIVYISKIVKESGKIMKYEITDDNEWASVQQLLKNIANAK